MNWMNWNDELQRIISSFILGLLNLWLQIHYKLSSWARSSLHQFGWVARASLSTRWLCWKEPFPIEIQASRLQAQGSYKAVWRAYRWPLLVLLHMQRRTVLVSYAILYSLAIWVCKYCVDTQARHATFMLFIHSWLYAYRMESLWSHILNYPYT